jgi:hypothetical protein
MASQDAALSVPAGSLGVSNCSLVTRTGVWVQTRVIRLSLGEWLSSKRSVLRRSPQVGTAAINGSEEQMFGAKQQIPRGGRSD